MTTFFRKRLSRLVTGKFIAFTLAGMLALPLAAHSQEQQDDDPYQDDEQMEVPTTTGPWQNSDGAAIGSTSPVNSTVISTGTGSGASSPNKNAPRLGRGGGALGRGPVTTAGGPGGNPDVPFDENMNLIFLAGGLIFAYLAVTGRLKLKAVPQASK